MKSILLMYARDTQRADAAVTALLDGLSVEARNENRKSYYKTLSGLAVHALGGTPYFHGMFRAAVPGAAAALKATEGLSMPSGDTLDAAQWRQLKENAAVADQATVDFIAALDEADFSRPVKLDWFGGNPDSVPLYYLLGSAYTHGVHHRGQISQILDEMGIEHDFSGLDPRSLPV
jgi:uncharacterized damage-inducible protein DinB